MKIIGFNQGQIGDLIMNLIPCKSLKEKYPDIHITFGINKRYESIKQIFYSNKFIDDFKIWENYDNWPSENDKKYLEENKFDKVFNPMPNHKHDNWYIKYHHTEAVCMMHDIEPPEDLQIELNPWFGKDEKFKNYIAFTPFASSAVPNRNMPIELANKIIDYIHSLGYKTIQLGLKTDPKINTSEPPLGGSILDDVKIAYSCKMLITVDTGMNWIMSGYKQKVLGFLCPTSYPIYAPIINRMPINPSATYLEHYNMNDINFSLIKQKIMDILNK